MEGEGGGKEVGWKGLAPLSEILNTPLDIDVMQ